MKAEQARLKRLRRLEKLRAVARRNAAAETARAEGTLAQLQSLAGRSQAIADSYDDRRSPRDGGELRLLASFVAGARAIAAATEQDAAKAHTVADRKLAELAAAERRRSAVEDRAEATARLILKRATPLSHGARTPIGTGLE